MRAEDRRLHRPDHGCLRGDHLPFRRDGLSEERALVKWRTPWDDGLPDPKAHHLRPPAVLHDDLSFPSGIRPGPDEKILFPGCFFHLDRKTEFI